MRRRGSVDQRFSFGHATALPPRRVGQALWLFLFSVGDWAGRAVSGRGTSEPRVGEGEHLLPRVR